MFFQEERRRGREVLPQHPETVGYHQVQRQEHRQTHREEESGFHRTLKLLREYRCLMETRQGEGTGREHAPTLIPVSPLYS